MLKTNSHISEQMAQKIVLFERYLNCHVCSETFRDPVSLSCNHSFCSSCLELFWKQAGNTNCPICKRKSSKDTHVNFVLKQLADSFAERYKTVSSETEEGEKKVEVVCSKHGEETQLFCEDEQKAVCPVCEFHLHQSHKVVPLEQAVSDLKDQLRSDLESLQDKRDEYEEVEETYQEVIQHSKDILFHQNSISHLVNPLNQILCFQLCFFNFDHHQTSVLIYKIYFC
uniref:RING-type domain-containing protein n=1 Tax=Cyclopterus lumpus TaxID=8103 RepID=A0A8C2WWK2_CYCLU